MATIAAKAPSYLGRALVGIALTVAFYALSFVAVAVLAGLPVWRVATGHTFPTFLGIAMVVTGLTILASVVPRRQRFELPGPELTHAGQPDVVGVVEQVAQEVGHRVPDAIYLDLDVNAGVAEVGTLLTAKRRVLTLGLPLLELLTVDQLRAVLAHEFGHYVAGDTRIGRRVYRTREAVLRTAGALKAKDEDAVFDQIVGAPFAGYAALFLRITAAVSRRQEHAADALAVRVAGRDAQVGALRRVAAGAPAFEAFWEEELEPVLSAGRRPPIGEGFRRFFTTTAVDSEVARVLDATLEQREHDRYDSHPTLRQRLDAIGATVADDTAPTGPLASALLRDHDTLEGRILAHLGGEAAADLRRIAWEDVGAVWEEHYRRLVERFGSVLTGRTVGDAPALARDHGDVARRLCHEDPEVDSEEVAEAIVEGLVPSAVTLALVRAGFRLEAPLAQPVRCVRGQNRFEPFVELSAISAREADPAPYADRLAAAGVARDALAIP